VEAAILFNRSLPNTVHAVTNLDRLESALARPMHTFDGKLLFPTLIERAAVLLHGVATAHGFFDGTNEQRGSARQHIWSAKGLRSRRYLPGRLLTSWSMWWLAASTRRVLRFGCLTEVD
jgi:hypothetical protein